MGGNETHHDPAAEGAERLVRRLHDLLRRPEDGASEADKLAASITVSDPILRTICDGSHYTLAEARALVRCLANHHANLDVRMLKMVAPDEKGVFSQDQFTCRVLELVTGITRGTHTMPLLLRMLRSASGRVLSKLIILMGQVRKDSAILSSHLRSPDSRIRANAIEALWGNSSHDCIALFHAACRDANHRVGVNAWIGLHLAGDREALFQIMQLTRHESPLWRAAAAWALGRIGDERDCEPVLRDLMADPESAVRGAATRAVVQLRKRKPAQILGQATAEATVAELR
jgi:hypothetical protein